MSTAVKVPAPKLTLRDTTDLELLVDAWVEEHIDEIELGGGVLPDDLAQILDEVQASRAERADAIAFKLDRLLGDASTAKATKDRAARREKVANNLRAAIKAYALREVERAGGEPIKGTACVLRIQKNGGKPAVDVRFENEQLLAFKDAGASLARFIAVDRIARVDTDALSLAYQARRTELERDVEILDESDISDLDAMRIAGFTANADGATPGDRAEAVAAVLAEMRAKYIADNLAAEFPGVTVVRGHHLRID